jgi:ribokinase
MKNETNKILVIGSLNIDLVSQVKHLPLAGETISSHKFHVYTGGKGANQAVGAAKLGANVTMIGKVGNDDYGTLLLKKLQQSGVRTDYVQKGETTGKAFITVDHKGENHIVLVAGANNEIGIKDIDMYAGELEKNDFIILQHEIPMYVVEYVIKLAKELNVKVILNPAPAQMLSTEILKDVHTLIPNETELSILTGKPTTNWEDIVEAARYLRSLGVKEVIVTMGSQGSYLLNSDHEAYIQAEKVRVIDTTAAGDSYVSAFAVGRTYGMSSLESAKFASKVSSITVTKDGAQSSLPSLHEVEHFGSFYKKAGEEV